MTMRVLGALVAMLFAGTAIAQQAGAPGEVRPTDDQTAEAGQRGAAAVVNQLARDVMVAQQVGYLAADKNMAASFALLGDQMALVNSQINRQLDRLVSDTHMQVSRQMDNQSQARFEQMKTLNKDQFASNLVAFINDTYPRMLTGIESLARQMPDSPAVAVMANEAVPKLRDQMRTAQQLAQQENGQQSAEQPNRGPIQRKDDPSVIPDTTPGRP